MFKIVSTILLSTLLFTSNVYSFVFPQAWVNAKHYSIGINDNDVVNAVHLENKGGKPILMLHAYMATMHEYMDLATELNKYGYDIYAINWNVDGRNLDESTKTVRSVIDYIYKKTNKKVLMVGHSLGTVLSKITLHGLNVDQQGKSYLDPAIKQWMKNHVRGLVSFSGPNGHEMKGDSGFLQNIPDQLLELMGADLSDIINNKKLFKETTKIFAMNNILTNLRYLPVDDLFKGLFSLSNFSYFDYSLSRFFLYGSENANPALKAQVDSFQTDMWFGSANREILFTPLFMESKLPVPSVYFVGENDEFVPAETVIAEAEFQGADYLVYNNTGHIDIFLAKNLQPTIRKILSFDNF